MTIEVGRVETPDSTLPPRSWQRWWDEVPRYWRIAAWSVLILFVVQFVVLTCTVFNYHEVPQITLLRNRGVEIHYFWERVWWEPTGRWKSEQEQLLWRGLMGRSCPNVGAAILEQPGNQDELVQDICRQFPNLECLIVRDAELSDRALSAISNCPRLKWLGLTGCDITDDGVQILMKHQQWVGIYLQGSLITDKSLPAFRQLKSLRYLNVRDTAVTSSAVDAWQSSPETSKVIFFANPRDSHFALSVVWPDGRRDSEFHTPFNLIVEGPFTNEKEASSEAPRQVITRQDGLVSVLQNSGDGNYRLSLSYGDHAAALLVEVKNGKLVPGHFEFRMPVTKSVALEKRQ